ncbi:hypothetical protein H6F77_11030 [Microcoleus sp. FACHB-831]|uniref:hypothetical protein n=1 Tax=Microcoleus sp. FACHB-831 TaxID=2692827 RepID=UPI0016825402|nr:hypothetical protein [Microcoleus sp. FACHB-831]MBD1921625.1 hypothetical protein [Microcoleus sp. FACHB-831]
MLTQLPSGNILRYLVHTLALFLIVCNIVPHVGGRSQTAGDRPKPGAVRSMGLNITQQATSATRLVVAG